MTRGRIPFVLPQEPKDFEEENAGMPQGKLPGEEPGQATGHHGQLEEAEEKAKQVRFFPKAFLNTCLLRTMDCKAKEAKKQARGARSTAMVAATEQKVRTE